MWRGNNMDKLFIKNHVEMYISSYKLFRVQLRECTIAGKFKNFNIFSIESNNANSLNDIANKISGTDVRINIASKKYVFLATLIYIYILTFIRKCICQPFKLLIIQGFKFQCTSKLFYQIFAESLFFVFINMYV